MADWYAKTNAELGPWWANFELRRTEFEAKYPILGTMKTQLAAIAAWMAYWTETRHVFDELGKQQSSYFNTISGNDPNADPPSPITWTMPAGQPAEVAPGIEKTIRDVRREIVGYTNYAKADGEAMGLEATTAQPISPNDVKPTITGQAAAHNYHASIVVAGREGATMWDVYILKKGGNWTKLTTCEGKSGDIEITPSVPGDAEQVQIYIQLRKGNANYGQPSDPIYLTFNP